MSSDHDGDDPIYRLTSNQRAILDLIRGQGSLSRAELAVLTGLTPGSLSRQIQELLAHALVEEGERRSGRRGQPALPISIRAEAAYSLGLSFSLHEIEAVALDFKGRKVLERSCPFAFGSVAELIGQCGALVAEMEALPPLEGSRILGVGIALPGYFQSDEPLTMDTFDALVMLAGIDLDVFRTAFGRPTWVENNSSAAALAEYYNRLDSDVRNLVLVNVGYGFSAGFILDGRLYRGRGGNAGEIGLLYPRGTPRPSAIDLVRTLGAAGRPVRSRAELGRRVSAGGEPVSGWIARAGRQLRHVMDVIDFTVAPDEIVLGGQIPGELAVRLGAAAAEAAGVPTRRARRHTSQLGPLAAAIGAAFLPIYRTSSPLLGTTRRRMRP